MCICWKTKKKIMENLLKVVHCRNCICPCIYITCVQVHHFRAAACHSLENINDYVMALTYYIKVLLFLLK